MKISEKRRKQMREYRIAHRKEINAKYREYYRKYRDEKPYFGGRRKRQAGSRKTKGYIFEVVASRLLKGATHLNADVERHLPWDIEWQGIKIDVKMRVYSTVQRGWQFVRTGRQADAFLFFCVQDGMVMKVLLVPREAFQKRSFFVGHGTPSRYELNLTTQ